MFCRSPFSAAARSASGVVCSRFAAKAKSDCISRSFMVNPPFRETSVYSLCAARKNETSSALNSKEGEFS